MEGLLSEDVKGVLQILSFEELCRRPIPHRPERHGAPVEYDASPVRIRGEGLHQVLWRGRQWAVTTYGIECLDGTYVIEAKRLAEKADVYPWTVHVTGKTWVDSDDFTTAWLVALSLHGARISKAQVRRAVDVSYPRKLRPPLSERTAQWQPPNGDNRQPNGGSYDT